MHCESFYLFSNFAPLLALADFKSISLLIPSVK